MAIKKKVVKKKVKKNIQTGIAHIQSTFNNTIITITDVGGATVAWSSSGQQGFKGSKKSTPDSKFIVASPVVTCIAAATMSRAATPLRGPGVDALNGILM